jgi:hypothetical protein
VSAGRRGPGGEDILSEIAIDLMRRIDRFQEAPRGQFTDREWRIVRRLVESGLCRTIPGRRMAVALADGVTVDARMAGGVDGPRDG